MIPYGKIQVITGVIPSKANRYRTTKKGGFYTDGKVSEYYRSFWAQCDVYRNKGINGPFCIEADVYFKTVKQDLDNVFKTVLDNLQTCGAIVNDKLCYRIIANKHIDSTNPRIEFKITPHDTKTTNM